MQFGLTQLPVALLILSCGYLGGCCYSGHPAHTSQAAPYDYVVQQSVESMPVVQNCCGDKQADDASNNSGESATLEAPHSRFHPVPTSPVFYQQVGFPHPGETVPTPAEAPKASDMGSIPSPTPVLPPPPPAVLPTRPEEAPEKLLPAPDVAPIPPASENSAADEVSPPAPSPVTAEAKTTTWQRRRL
jgi:hypothetical protein